MKNLIAQMDAIETGKKYIAESVELIVEYKGGTDAEKIKNWQKHIDQFKEKGMYKAADDATKAAKTAQPGFGKTNKSAKEGMGSIARALMQDMGLDDQAIDEVGQPPPGWNSEVNGVWMGDNPTMVPAVDSSGRPVQAGSGGNVMSLGPGKQGGQKPAQAGNPLSNSNTAANLGQQVDSLDAAAGAAAQQARAEVDTPELNIGQGPQNGPTTTGGQKPAYPPGDTVANWREPSGQSQTTFTPGPTPPKVDGGQKVKPSGGTGMNPAVAGYAERLGLTTNGKPDPNKVKAFQQQQGLTADGIIGPQTIGSIISAGSALNSGGAGRTAPGATAQQIAGAQKVAGPATQGQVRAVDQAIAAKDRASQPAPKRPTQVGAPSKAVQDWDAKYSTTHDPRTGMPLTGAKTESIAEDDRILNMIRGIKV